jgi:hypothetical protein
MSRSGEMWYPQKTQDQQNIVQKLLKYMKRCFTNENEVNPVYISTIHEDAYGSIRNG